jgi:hypothetical protein
MDCLFYRLAAFLLTAALLCVNKNDKIAPFTPFINYVVLALFCIYLNHHVTFQGDPVRLINDPIWFILLLILYSRRNSASGKIAY